MTERQKKYREYLRSAWWRARRQQRLRAAGDQCEHRQIVDENPARRTIYGDRCAATGLLEVHHKNYETLGRESDEDLEVLCNKHHILRHVLSTVKCILCGEPPFYWEEDAELAVEDASRELGPDFSLEAMSLPDECPNCGQDWGWKRGRVAA